MANSVYPDEVGHGEPPYPDIRCLQISVIFIFGVLSVHVGSKWYVTLSYYLFQAIYGADLC